MEMPEYEAPRRRRRPRRRRKSGFPLVCAAAALAALGVLLSQVLDHRLPGDGVAVPEYFCDIACNSPKPGLQSAAILQFGQFPYSRKQNFLRKLIGFFS